MPPVGPPQNGQDGTMRPRRSVLSSSNAEKDDFLCKVKYLNRLPDLPADPKFLQFNVDMAPYVKYTATALEKDYKRDINCDSDMGMKLNLLTIQHHRVEGTDIGRETDAQLCADDILSEPVNSKPTRDHSKHVAWLRKSQYILNDFAQSRADTPAEKQVRKPHTAHTDFHLHSRLNRAEAINELFEYANRKQKRHPNKPHLTVVEETAIFPNIDLMGVPMVGVTFENDPAPPSTPQFTPDQVMANSMLRGMMDEAGNQLVAYFTPTDESLQRLIDTRDEEHVDDEFTFKLHREFSLPADERTKQVKDDTIYALAVRSNAAYYTDLETKVRLLRRPRGMKKGKSKLLVKFRTQAEADEAAKQAEMAALEEGSGDEAAEAKRAATPVPTSATSPASSDDGDNMPVRKAQAPSDDDEEEEASPPKTTDSSRGKRPVTRSPSPGSKSETSDSEPEKPASKRPPEKKKEIRPTKYISKEIVSSSSSDDSD